MNTLNILVGNRLLTTPQPDQCWTQQIKNLRKSSNDRKARKILENRPFDLILDDVGIPRTELTETGAIGNA